MTNDITITVPAPNSSILHLPSSPPRRLALLLAATALILQGCTAARPAWSHKADANPLARSAFERMEPREGIALVNFNF